MDYTDIGKNQAILGFQPATTIEAGILRFIEWYREYHPLTAPSYHFARNA